MPNIQVSENPSRTVIERVPRKTMGQTMTESAYTYLQETKAYEEMSASKEERARKQLEFNLAKDVAIQQNAIETAKIGIQTRQNELATQNQAVEMIMMPLQIMTTRDKAIAAIDANPLYAADPAGKEAAKKEVMSVYQTQLANANKVKDIGNKTLGITVEGISLEQPYTPTEPLKTPEEVKKDLGGRFLPQGVINTYVRENRIPVDNPKYVSAVQEALETQVTSGQEARGKMGKGVLTQMGVLGEGPLGLGKLLLQPPWNNPITTIGALVKGYYSQVFKDITNINPEWIAEFHEGVKKGRWEKTFADWFEFLGSKHGAKTVKKRKGAALAREQIEAIPRNK